MNSRADALEESMVEKVAKAIAARMTVFPCTDLDCAVAAIEAMRETTLEMRKAGFAVQENADVWNIWQAMIDAALTSK